jgi:O-methyltransferase
MDNFYSSLVQFRKNIIEVLKKVEFTTLDKTIIHEQIIPGASYSPWRNDNDFVKCYEIIKNNTLVDIYRCYELWYYIKKHPLLFGDILEVGVWRGGTGCLLAKAAELFSGSKVYLADTFSGVVKATGMDSNYKGGEHADTSIKIVQELVDSLKLNNIRLLKGVFPNEVNLDHETVKPKIKLCHIDVDTYDSAKDVFNYIWQYVIKGGAVIFDDYGFWGCEGVTKLGNELAPRDAIFIYNINGHAIFIKL